MDPQRTRRDVDPSQEILMLMFTRIQIQTVSWCNRSCAFCPSGKFPVAKTFMPLAVYHRVIDQLRALKFSGRISPYLMNESLLDKRLPELIAYARQQCPESWIAINTNGDALSESLAERLFEAGLNCMDVNAYDDTSQYETHMAMAERVVARHPEIQLTSGYLDPNFNATDLPRHTKLLHCRDMSDWEHRFNDKLDVADLFNRAGNVPGALHLAEPLALGCERPFQQMYVNHRGEAVLCCNDWRFEVVMGDTAEASLLDIWNNDKYRTYRDHLRRQDRHLPLCAACDYRGKSSD
jgi:MoaA/NifB/PqqE/SkfB family radical SAM enzyme